MPIIVFLTIAAMMVADPKRKVTPTWIAVAAGAAIAVGAFLKFV